MYLTLFTGVVGHSNLSDKAAPRALQLVNRVQPDDAENDDITLRHKRHEELLAVDAFG